MCIRPCAASGASQRIGLVDAQRRAVGVDQQILRPVREAERRARQRLARLHVARLAGAACGRRRRLGIGRLVAEAAGAIDRAEQDLQQVQQRGRSGSRWSGRRCRAWRASPPGGRSSCRGGGRPSRSRDVERRSACSKAACASSAAMRRMVSAGMPVSLGDRLRRVGRRSRIALGEQLEHRHAPRGRRAA